MTNSAPRMSMNRVIHGAVRRDLDRFRRALDGFVGGDRDRAEALHRAWTNFHDQLTEHHEGEHEITWPALEAIGIPTSTLASFDTEHERMAADLAAAGEAMSRLRRSATRADADSAATAIATLHTSAVTHLDHEEEETEAALLQHESDPAVKQIGWKFGQGVSLAKAGWFFAWVQDGATPEQRLALAATMPRPMLAAVSFLFGRRYGREIAPTWSR